MNKTTLIALEHTYKNAETPEHLRTALEYHEVSETEFYNLATEMGWTPGPMAVESLLGSPLLEAGPEHIDKTTKAALRRIHMMLEAAVTKLHAESQETNTIAQLGQLETVVKIREKLTKLELPLYGLTTAEPISVQNPINIFMSADEPEENPVVEEK